MPDLWPEVELGTLVVEGRPICYGVLKPGEYYSAGVPLIRILDIENDRINEDSLWQISAALDHAFKRSRLEGGELLVSIQGTIGRVAIAPQSVSGANISRTIARVAVDHSKIDVRFIRHWLKSNVGMRTIEDATVGTTRSSLNINSLRVIHIPKPLQGEQSRISDILDALDDAILETDAVVEKLRSIHVGIINDLLTRGLADDGSPRDQSAFAETAVGFRPAAWTVANLGRFVVGAEYGTNLSLGDTRAVSHLNESTRIHNPTVI